MVTKKSAETLADDFVGLAKADFGVLLADFDEKRVNRNPNTDYWIKKSVEINAPKWILQSAVLQNLREEGHDVNIVNTKALKHNLEAELSKPEDERDTEKIKQLTDEISLNEFEQKSLSEELKELKKENVERYCIEISSAQDFSSLDVHYTKIKKARTKDDTYSLAKFFLKQKYAVPVDSLLVEKDIKGWYGKIRAHYMWWKYRNFPHLYLKQETDKLNEKLVKDELFFTDYTNPVAMVKLLEDGINLSKLLVMNGHNFRDNPHPIVCEIASNIRENKLKLKKVMTFTFKENEEDSQGVKDFKLVQKLLRRLGLKMESTEKPLVEVDGKMKQKKTYSFAETDDGRLQIFDLWLMRDIGLPKVMFSHQNSMAKFSLKENVDEILPIRIAMLEEKIDLDDSPSLEVLSKDLQRGFDFVNPDDRYSRFTFGLKDWLILKAKLVAIGSEKANEFMNSQTGIECENMRIWARVTSFVDKIQLTKDTPMYDERGFVTRYPSGYPIDRIILASNL